MAAVVRCVVCGESVRPVPCYLQLYAVQDDAGAPDVDVDLCLRCALALHAELSACVARMRAQYARNW